MPSQIVSLVKAMDKKELLTNVGSNILKELIQTAAGKIVGPIGKDWNDKWSDSKPGWKDTWENHWTGDSAIALTADVLNGLPVKGLVETVKPVTKFSAVHAKNLPKLFSEDELKVLKELKLL
jgi:hypothetical protein